MKAYFVGLALSLGLSNPGMAAAPPLKGSVATAARHYSTATTPIGTLLDDAAARAIVDRHLPKLSADRRIFFARKLTLRAIQPMSQGEITVRQLAAIDADLKRLRRRR